VQVSVYSWSRAAPFAALIHAPWNSAHKELDNAIPAYQLSQTDAFYVLAQEPIGAFGDGATSRMLCSVLDDLGKQGRTRARVSRFRRMRRIHRYFLWRQR